LVEVEKAPKPLPACATPVTEGMKVFTQIAESGCCAAGDDGVPAHQSSARLPDLDQGGECELQDLAMVLAATSRALRTKAGRQGSRNLGPLVSTDMTRCIHCTRCIRFGAEIQGYPQWVRRGRGEHMEVGTIIEHSVPIHGAVPRHQFDLCRWGRSTTSRSAITRAAWEMQQARWCRRTMRSHESLRHVLRGKDHAHGAA